MASFILPLPSNSNCCSHHTVTDIDLANLEAPCRYPLSYGSHIGLQTTLLETAKLQHCYNLKAAQVYLGGNSAYEVRNVSTQDRQETHDYLKSIDAHLHVHASLLINLCSDRTEVQERSAICLQATLNQIEWPGQCVVHIGSSKSRNYSQSLKTIATHVNSLEYHDRLLMENSAGDGNKLGFSLDQLRILYESLDRPVGLCIDTQHAFAAGLSRLQTYEDVTNLFDSIEEITGKDQRCRVIHLNDSKIEYQARIDRHMELFQGYIWGSSEGNRVDKREGLIALLQRCSEKQIDVVLETPNNHHNELNYLKSIQL